MWIDILGTRNKEPKTIIFPKVQNIYELRVVIWKTKDLVTKNGVGKLNDIYVRGGIERGDRFYETDTHWRCRNIGSFNWRWKYDISLPVDENKNYGEDKFKL